MQSDAGHTVYERLMSRLGAEYERVVILTKREEDRIAEWTRGEQNGIKNEERRGRKDKMGGERGKQIRSIHERFMSKL